MPPGSEYRLCAGRLHAYCRRRPGRLLIACNRSLECGADTTGRLWRQCSGRGPRLQLPAQRLTHNQTALVVVFEDSSGVTAAEHADRAVFLALLASIRFR